MEDAWNEGFDPDGARHYRHTIVRKSGNKAKIGAMEVANLCWYHGIDAVVIQFVKCFESRGLLPYFFLAYFAQRTAFSTGTNGEFDEEAFLLASKVLSEATRLSKLPLRSIESLVNSGRNSNTTAMPSLLPVYLQWEGHSVTVVGIEFLGDGTELESSSSALSANFLVLDPLKKSQTLQSDLMDQQQQRLPPSVKLPWSQISSKDLQIIVCTGRSMAYSERQLCKSGGGNSLPPRGRVLTAAEVAVMKHLNRHQR